ncbi:tetratricopeptide repeat-containing protein [Toxoplasma gondii GAB2-2007-GAL-DOM2]|nr:tetratricopeptide repeat-containing protein [Toxoplasma gondii GT1]KFG48051.1 tetratricopeptide repeat-containing protein [Toxoplasma gondii GAB2-2007-GAL-DOM2]KFG55585.1 tetratricopeptide repeat-containing protein [Toxoplasma gondii FOU]PUA92917.1 tetratricopeptide repeat-containing protein [Toxoplasma gondii TgCATBr9]RQX74738.1 tetratricopeptide repeat-containing protein [Toxoplasma gondii CAST]
MGGVSKAKGATRSSEKALHFAERFLDDEREKKKLQEEVNGTRDNGGLTADSAVGLQNDEPDAAKKSSPLQVMSNTDYGKYERLSKRLDEEEERKKKKEEADAMAAREMMQGCSHDHSKERQIYEKPTGEKIDAAERFRQEGNAAFREKNYGLAAVNYRKALLQFDYTFPDTDEEQKRMDSVKLPCHLNLAACKLQQQDYEEVYIQCRLALEMDPKNTKAYYRRGLAHLQQDNFVKAKEDLMEALTQEPSSKEIRDALQLLREKIHRYHRRSAMTYKAMLKSDGSEETVGDSVASPAETISEKEASDACCRPESMESIPAKACGGCERQAPEKEVDRVSLEAAQERNLREEAFDQRVPRKREETRSEDPVSSTAAEAVLSSGYSSPETKAETHAHREATESVKHEEGRHTRSRTPSSSTHRTVRKVEEVSDDEDRPAASSSSGERDNCAARGKEGDSRDDVQNWGEGGAPRGRKRSYNEAVVMPLHEKSLEERRETALEQGRELHQKLLLLLRQKQQELKAALERECPDDGSASEDEQKRGGGKHRRASFASTYTVSSAGEAFSLRRDDCSDIDGSFDRRRHRSRAFADGDSSVVSPYGVALIVAVSAVFSACIGLLVGLLLGSGGRDARLPAQPEPGVCTPDGCTGNKLAALPALATATLQSVGSFLSDGGVILAGLAAAVCVGIALLLIFLDEDGEEGIVEERTGVLERRHSVPVSRRAGTGGRQSRAASVSGRNKWPGVEEESSDDGDKEGGGPSGMRKNELWKGEGISGVGPAPRRRKLTAEYIEEVAGPQRDIGSFPQRKTGKLHSDPTFDAVLQQWCN